MYSFPLKAIALAVVASIADAAPPESDIDEKLGERVLERTEVLTRDLQGGSVLTLTSQLVEYPFDADGETRQLKRITYALDWTNLHGKQRRRIWHERHTDSEGHFKARDFRIGVRDAKHVTLAYFSGMLVRVHEIDLEQTVPPLPAVLRRKKDFDPSKVQRLKLEGNPNVINLPAFLDLAQLGAVVPLPKLTEVRWREGYWEVVTEVAMNYRKVLPNGRVVSEDRRETLVFKRKPDRMSWTLAPSQAK